MDTRTLYDQYYVQIERCEKQKKVIYVACDCGYLAIRQKSKVELFRCSKCTKLYHKTKLGYYDIYSINSLYEEERTNVLGFKWK